MIEIHDWVPVGHSSDISRLNPETGYLEERVTYYRGPTPIIGENGQLELLKRSLAEQRRQEILARLALKQ